MHNTRSSSHQSLCLIKINRVTGLFGYRVLLIVRYRDAYLIGALLLCMKKFPDACEFIDWPLLSLVWGQLSFSLHKMLEANPIHIWKLQTMADHFQHLSKFFSPFCVFYRPDENDVIKSFLLNNSSSKTWRMFILHALLKNFKIYLLAKFQPDYVIFVFYRPRRSFTFWSVKSALLIRLTSNFHNLEILLCLDSPKTFSSKD